MVKENAAFILGVNLHDILVALLFVEGITDLFHSVFEVLARHVILTLGIVFEEHIQNFLVQLFFLFF